MNSCDICGNMEKKKPYGKTNSGISIYLSTLLIVLDCGLCDKEISCCQDCINESEIIKCKSCRRNDTIDDLI